MLKTACTSHGLARGDVRANSSLDLTEILTSEGLLSDEELDAALRSMAQEHESDAIDAALALLLDTEKG